MNPFRSHLFPHFAFVAVLALVTVVGLTRLKRNLDAMRLTRLQQRTAWEATQHCATIRNRVRLCHEKLFDRQPGATLATEYRLVSIAIVAAGPCFANLEDTTDSRIIPVIDQEVRVLLARPEPERGSAFRAAADGHLSHIETRIERIEQRANDEFARHSTTLLGLESGFGHEAILSFIVLVVLSLAYFYVVNWLLARPIQDLAKVARTVTRGQLRERAKASVDGPVAELATDFNNMVDILVESLAEEERVVRKLERRTAELQQANEHKSRFLANISHELKTPLNAVIGFTDIMLAAQHGPLSDRQREYLQRIFQAGQHLLAMISDLIDLAKLDLGALRLRPEPTALPPLIQEAIALLLPAAAAKKHTLVYAPAADVSVVLLDPRRVKQMLLNLLSNAVKFTPDGGRIEVVLKVAGEVELSVRDSGIGISKADQKRLFQDFVQLDSALHRQHEGTGIGLALTRRLAELMGGKLRLDSEPGRGSTFTILLPATRPSATPPLEPNP